jgi:hypothetical protein
LGALAVFVTRVVYTIEDCFERLPIHWMWWPPIGALAVGIVGYFAPDTLGVGMHAVHRAPKFVYDDCTVRQATDHMVNHDIGRLPVVRRARPNEVIGMVARSDVLSVFRRRAHEVQLQEPSLRLLPRRSLQTGKRNPRPLELPTDDT